MRSETASELSVDPRFSVGRRVSVSKSLGTIKFVGPVSGTTGIWLGIEWDQADRGKHSGEKDGVQYFTCSVPGSASFIRPSSKISFGVSFISALEGKYIDHSDPWTSSSTSSSAGISKVETVTLGANSKIDVEAPNMDKVRNRLKMIGSLKSVGLQSEEISEVGLWPEATQFNIRSLDISRNLLPNIEMVAHLVSHLDFLESLSLNSNRFNSLIIDVHNTAFKNILNLSLDNTLIGWENLLRLQRHFPALASLDFGFNRLTRLKVKDLYLDQQLFSKLEHLNLVWNLFESWDDLAPLKSIPNLKRLNLTFCKISTISPTSTVILSYLENISLTSNLISSWDSIEALRTVTPSLTHLSVGENPLFLETNDTDIKKKSSRALIIGALPQLAVLNGSEISTLERKESELFYLARKPGNNHPEEIQVHLQSLKRKYEVEDILTPSAPPDAAKLLQNKLLEVTIRYAGSQDTTIKVLPTMTIKMLKMKLQKMTKLPAARMVLGVSGENLDEEKNEIGHFVEAGAVINVHDRSE